MLRTPYHPERLKTEILDRHCNLELVYMTIDAALQIWKIKNSKLMHGVHRHRVAVACSLCGWCHLVCHRSAGARRQ